MYYHISVDLHPYINKNSGFLYLQHELLVMFYPTQNSMMFKQNAKKRIIITFVCIFVHKSKQID
jgi:hypothetical protein